MIFFFFWGGGGGGGGGGASVPSNQKRVPVLFPGLDEASLLSIRGLISPILGFWRKVGGGMFGV